MGAAVWRRVISNEFVSRRSLLGPLTCCCCCFKSVIERGDMVDRWKKRFPWLHFEDQADSDFQIHRYFVIVNWSLLTSTMLLYLHKMKVITRHNGLTECRDKTLKAKQKERDTEHSKLLNKWFIKIILCNTVLPTFSLLHTPTCCAYA